MADKKSSAVRAVKGAVAKAAGRATPAGKVVAKKRAQGRQAAPAKKASPTRAASGSVKKTAAKKTAAKRPVEKAPAKKTAAKKTVEKAPAKKTTTKKSADARSALSKKAPAKKAPAKKASTKKAAAKAPAKTAVPRAVDKVATKAAAVKTAKKAPARAGRMPIRDEEKPWTAGEVREVRSTLEHDRVRLVAEIAATEQEISHLLREGGEGAGNDQADVGSSTFERDHEMSMAQTARDSLAQVEAALARIGAGNYGVCESCGKPIGKMRLQAFPRATLCMECKQRQERR